jgi:hypothetical protein
MSRTWTRNNYGDMVPIGSVATFRDTTGPFRVPRYNLYPAAEVQLGLARGFSTGQAIEKIAKERLPQGFGFEWTEIALQEKLAGNTAMIAFGLAVTFVFLLLPLAVVLIVPMCILAAMLRVNARGLDRNILVEIGLVVLVGLAGKNAILIVEFARQAEVNGMDRFEAAVAAARTRLRPILMTSLAFILSVVPLAVAAGAEMRHHSSAVGSPTFAEQLLQTFRHRLIDSRRHRQRHRQASSPIKHPHRQLDPTPSTGHRSRKRLTLYHLGIWIRSWTPLPSIRSGFFCRSLTRAASRKRQNR